MYHKIKHKTTYCRACCKALLCLTQIPFPKTHGTVIFKNPTHEQKRGKSNPEGWNFQARGVEWQAFWTVFSSLCPKWLNCNFQMLWYGEESGCLQRRQKATVIPKQYHCCSEPGYIISEGRVCGVSSFSRMLLDMPSLINQKDDPPHQTHPSLINA